MPYSAQQVATTMNIFGVGANDAKKIIDGVNGVSQKRVLDPVQRSVDKNFQKALYESLGDLAPLAYQLYNVSKSNSAWSAQQASDLRTWQEGMMKFQMDYNASEAAKNRNWQEMMSNTAHQREVKDLLAAGLNPVLSATGGNGAAVTSGSTASASLPSGAMGTADTSANSAIVGLLGSMLSAQTQLASTAMSAANNLAITEKNNSNSKQIAQLSNAMSEKIAQMYVDQGYYSSLLSYYASKYGADSSRVASAYASQLAADASKYGSLMGYNASVYATDTSAQTQKDIAQNNPSSWPGFLSAWLNHAGGNNGTTPYDLMVISPVLKYGVQELQEYYEKELHIDRNTAYNKAYSVVMAQLKKLQSTKIS